MDTLRVSLPNLANAKRPQKNTQDDNSWMFPFTRRYTKSSNPFMKTNPVTSYDGRVVCCSVPHPVRLITNMSGVQHHKVQICWDNFQMEECGWRTEKSWDDSWRTSPYWVVQRPTSKSQELRGEESRRTWSMWFSEWARNNQSRFDKLLCIFWILGDSRMRKLIDVMNRSWSDHE